MKILILANDTTYTWNLRSALLRQLVAQGHPVTVLAQRRSHVQALEALGCRVEDVQIHRRGKNPVQDLLLLREYIARLRVLRPDAVLSFNLKPNLYGGMACRLLGIRFLPNITGLGQALEQPGPLQKLILFLCRRGLKIAETIFFQNRENQAFFHRHHLLPKGATEVLLPGSGVDLTRFPLLPYPKAEPVHFLFASRLLMEKGIGLYLDGARTLAARHPEVCFHVCGHPDDPRYLPRLREAEEAGYLRYYGEQPDMLPFYRLAHCLVHPSDYPEGMSNVLLEAAASGRPIITTHRPGCREAVDPGVTGFLIPARDPDSLVAAMEAFLALPSHARQALGLAGRAKMEREFDRNLVVKAYFQALFPESE